MEDDSLSFISVLQPAVSFDTQVKNKRMPLTSDQAERKGVSYACALLNKGIDKDMP